MNIVTVNDALFIIKLSHGMQCASLIAILVEQDEKKSTKYEMKEREKENELSRAYLRSTTNDVES